jgi:hypothetical protein
MTRYLLLFESYGLVFVGCPLWREDRFVFCMCCWPLSVQSFSGLSLLRLATTFCCLRFETSLFVASYDSQDHGGGIRSRLHTGSHLCLSHLSSRPLFLVILPRVGPFGKHFHCLAMDVLYCCLFVETRLPNNGLFTKNLSPRKGVYRAVAKQWVYMSQYVWGDLHYIHCFSSEEIYATEIFPILTLYNSEYCLLASNIWKCRDLQK